VCVGAHSRHLEVCAHAPRVAPSGLGSCSRVAVGEEGVRPLRFP